MFCRPISLTFAALAAVLYGAAPGMNLPLSAQTNTVASYASGTAHATLGSATGSVASAIGLPGVLPGVLNVQPTAAVEDSAGNLYFSTGSEIDMLYTADINGNVPPLLAFAAQHGTTNVGSDPANPVFTYTPQKGMVYAVVGLGPTDSCSAGFACGDGSFAVNAQFGFVGSMAFDSTGNLYLVDESLFAIRKVDQGTGLIDTVAGDPNHSISAASPDGVSASSATFVGPSSIALQGGSIFIADQGANVVRKIGTNGLLTTVAGDLTQVGNAPCTDNVCGEGQLATSTLLGGVFGIAVSATGDLYLAEFSDNVVRKVGTDGIIHTVAGTRGSICADPVCGDGGPATSALLNGPFALSLNANEDIVISDLNDNAVRGVRQSDGFISTIAGGITQSQSVTQGDEAAKDGGPASQLLLTIPEAAFIDSVGKLVVTDLSFVWTIDPPASKQSQTIEFDALAPVTYGTAPIALSARSIRGDGNVTGLNITYTVSPANLATVSGATLTILGAGAITVTANQAGNTVYSAAASATQILTVDKAPLSITVDSLSFTFGSGPALPPLTYHVIGFVNGDTASAVLSGHPVLQTGATTTSAVGSYPIIVTLGTLAAINYALTPQNGVLTITGGAAQSITFNALAAVVYGAPAIALGATSSSGLPVAYTVSGPAAVSGSRLVVNGTGTVTVTAAQTGDTSFGPAASVTQTFQVTPAPLTITANNATRVYNQPDGPFTYIASGFVHGDTAAVLSGAPIFLPPPTSAIPGQYPLGLDGTGGTLFAANYTFNLVAGTLTVTSGVQTITFPQLADTSYGTSGVPWKATSSSGLPVTITASGPIQYNQFTFSALPADGSVAIGTVTVTATQTGNALFAAAAPVTQTFQTVRDTVAITANSISRAFGAPNPPFTFYIRTGDSLVSLGNTFSGLPDATTTADATSPQGDYPIVLSQGTLQSPVHTFQFVNGTLSVLPQGSFTLTATPTAVTVPIGRSASVEITLNPLNDFAGSVSVGCGNLPPGVTCVLSPQTLTPTPGTTTGGVTGAVSGVLTIVAASGSASIQTRQPFSLAGMLWVPCLPGGLLIAFYRKRLVRKTAAQRLVLLLLLLLPLGAMVACSSGSKNPQNSVQPGSSTIQIIGNGVAPDGTMVTNQLNLTIELQ